MATPGGGTLQCASCSRTFKRVAHLRRHERGHSTQKPHRCSICNRSFARRDALQRHRDSHVDAPSLLQLGTRACLNCAAAKTRCSGEQQCLRCRDRRLVCEYPAPQTLPRSVSAPVLDPKPVSLQPGTALLPTQSHLTSHGLDQFSFLHPVQSQLASELTAAAPLAPSPPVINPSNDTAGASLDAPSLAIWDDDDVFAINWLEEPVGQDSGVSPLLWDLPFAAQPLAPSAEYASSTAFATSSAAMLLSSATALEAESSPGGGRIDLSSPDGEYYVDGGPARLSRGRKYAQTTTKQRQGAEDHSSLYSLAHVELPPDGNEKEPQRSEISEANYQQLMELYGQLCLTSTALWTLFTDHPLPAKQTLHSLIALYRNHFDSVLPFQHWTDFESSDRHFLVDLATAAIGSQYTHQAHFAASMHEFLRRCLVFTSEDRSEAPMSELPLAIATLLNVIGLMYCGKERLRTHALNSRGHFKARFDDLSAQANASSMLLNVDEGAAQGWNRYLDEEKRLRVLSAMWLVDALIAFHEDLPPMLDIQSLQLPLPCSESIWKSRILSDWETPQQSSPLRSNLVDTLQELFYRKHFSDSHSEFAGVLVIHGLIHRLWDVKRYYSSPLSFWEPSSSRSSGDMRVPKSPMWLPAIPEFRKWQNSACDALDVLHWQANGVIGINRGMEHPLVLHLHAARVALLAPYGDILALARSIIAQSASSVRPENSEALTRVRRWAIFHQYKARLCVIHAGVTFWHVRRHGVDAFYEPSAVGLATLVLWAFSTFARRVSREPSHSDSSMVASRPTANPAPTTHDNEGNARDGAGDEDIDNTEGLIILLDRPTDDELVQNFIRDGGAMQPHMSGIGEVYGAHAPQRILRQGIRLLAQQECWAVSASWTILLTRLRGAIHHET